MKRTGITLSTARWSARHPWRAIGVWAVLVAVAVGFGMAMPMKTTTDADYRVGQSGTASRWIHDAGLDTPDTEYVVVSDESGGTVGSAEQVVAGTVRAELGKVSQVREVSAPVTAPDRSMILVAATLKDVADGQDPDISGVKDAVQDAQARAPSMRLVLTGDTALNDAINDRVASDLSSAEVISLPVTLALMLLVFAALIAAGIPVLLALTSVAATMGLMGPISLLVPMEPTVTSMILLIGMAVGVDYSLFYLKRERQERQRGARTADAIEIAAATSGHSIVVSGFAVAASMVGLFVVGDVTFNSLATGSLLVVVIAVCGSLTVLPALLALFGHKVDRPRIPLLWRLSARMTPGSVSKRVLSPVLRHPVVGLLVGMVSLLALAAPAVGMKLQTSSLDTLPRDIPAVHAMQQVGAAFPGDGPTSRVVLTGADRDALESQAATVERRAVATGDWRRVSDATQVSTDGRTVVLTLGSRAADGSSASGAAVEQLRGEVLPTAVPRGSGTQWAVGGDVAADYDQLQQQSDGLPKVLAFVLGLTMIMMAITFRSVVIAVLTAMLNLVSVGAAFGVVTLVFQHTWAESVMHFHSTGGVISWIPIFLFVVLMGLSMDYHVFVLSRVREHVAAGMPARLAVRQGVQETAGVVTSAAVVMISVFALFATLSMVEMKELGVGLAVAIALDATLVRLVVLPSALALLGDKAWWPMRPAPTRSAGPVSERRSEPALAHR